MIKYKAMSLFNAPIGSIIIHAVNAQGVWGNGIAKEFKERYPLSFAYYTELCRNMKTIGFGTFKNFKEEKHQVGWICTSQNYGANKDNEIAILANTKVALLNLCDEIEATRILNGFSSIDVYSNKFNSGLFGVKWEKTEEILKQVLDKYPKVNWIVCDNSIEQIPIIEIDPEWA